MPVMLSGMGGDEIFAGYPRYLAYGISRSLDRIPRPIAPAGSSGSSRESHGPGGPGGCAARAATCGSSCAAPDCRPLERYLAFSTLLHDDRASERSSRRASPRRSATTTRSPATAPIRRGRRRRRAQPAAVPRPKTFLPCLNLTYTDKMAMAASVEVRVPLLDDELVALAARIPSITEAARTEAQVHLQEEPGARAAARHRLAEEGGLRRADPLMARAGSRTARRGAPLRGDVSPARHRRPGDRGAG